MKCPVFLFVLLLFVGALNIVTCKNGKSYEELSRELMILSPEDENWEATVNVKILDSQGKSLLHDKDSLESTSDSTILKAKLKRALRIMGRFFFSDWKKHLPPDDANQQHVAQSSKENSAVGKHCMESIAKDSGNDWMLRDFTNDAIYFYEGGKDALGKRSGKGILIGKLEDYMYVGGYSSDKRHGFGIEIVLRSSSYYAAAGLFSGGKRVIRLPIPCPMRRLVEKLFQCPDRMKLLRCILWHVPICRSSIMPKGINGENSTPPPLAVAPPNPNALFHEVNLGFGIDASMTIFKSSVSTKITNFSSSFKYSWSFLVHSNFTGIATVQIISLTKFFTPQIRIHKCMYRINSHMDKDSSTPSYIYLDHRQEGKSKVAAHQSAQDLPGNSNSSVPVSWLKDRTYVIEVGLDEPAGDSSFPALKNGDFIVRIGDFGDPLPWYSEFLGTKYQSVCTDWRYAIGLNEGGKIDQYLEPTDAAKLSGSPEKLHYVCGLLNLKMAPSVDVECGSVIFYYTDGEIQQKKGTHHNIKRAGSLVLRQGESTSIGYTRETNLFYDSECKHQGVDALINRVRSWVKQQGDKQESAPVMGLRIDNNSCITSLHNISHTPSNFSPTLSNSYIILFNPVHSGRYNVILISATSKYHPSMRIFSHKPGQARDPAENVEIKPLISDSGQEVSYQLCAGKTYILEVGIPPQSSKVFSINNGDFWAIFTKSSLSLAQRIKRESFSVEGGDNIKANYNINLRKEGQFKKEINRTAGGEKTIGIWDPEIVPYVNLRESFVDFFYPEGDNRHGNSGFSTLGILRVHLNLPSKFSSDPVQITKDEKEKLEITVANVSDPGAASIFALINESNQIKSSGV